MGNTEAAKEFNKLKLMGIRGSIELVVDPIDESLDELSAIASAWKNNRDRNRPSPILRRAMISAAQELIDNVDVYLKQQSDKEKRKINL